MCGPAAPFIALAGAAVTAAGQVAGGMMANKQAKYEAKLAERNAQMEIESARESIRIGKDEVADHYRQLGQLKGRQIAAMAANGIEVDMGSAARLQADTAAQGAEDANRIYRNNTARTKGYLIQAANDRAAGAAARYRGKSELFSGAVSGAGTLMSAAAQFGKARSVNKAAP